MPPYTIKKSPRAKNIRITVRLDESVTVTVPKRMSLSRAEAFVKEKENWIQRILANIRRRPKPAYELPRACVRDYKTHRAEAIRIANERLVHWNSAYGFSWKNVTIKNTASRWGSCSKIGNLNFNYRLVFLPPHLQDYLVVHELCHLKEMNHSPQFWKLVEKTMPEYQILRRQLRGLE